MDSSWGRHRRVERLWKSAVPRKPSFEVLTSNDIQRGTDNLSFTEMVLGFDIEELVCSSFGDLMDTNLVCALRVSTIFLLPISLLGRTLAIGRKGIEGSGSGVSVDTRKDWSFGSHVYDSSVLRSRLWDRRNG